MTLMNSLFIISCVPMEQTDEGVILGSESQETPPKYESFDLQPQQIADTVEQIAETAKKITETVGQVTEQPAEQIAEQATEQPAKQATEQPMEQTAEQATEQATEQPAEQIAEQATEQTAEQATEQVAEQPAEQATEQPAEQAAEQPREQANIFQECRTNLLSSLWRCTKGEEVIKYLLNQQPTHIDDEGTDRERIRICELHAVTGDREPSSEGDLIAHAHWQKDHCTNRLNEETGKIQEEGFVCESTEFFDEGKLDESCPSGAPQTQSEN